MRDTGMVLDVVYKGKVYELYIKETDKEPRLNRPRRSRPAQVRPIDVKSCEECASLQFNGICMNRECKSNLLAS